MHKYLTMILKSLFVLICFYLSYNIPYVGFSLVIIEFVLFTIIFFPFGILVIPILIYYKEIHILYLFPIITSLSFLKFFFLKNKIYLFIFIVLVSFLSSFIYYKDIIFSCYFLFIFSALGIAFIYSTDVYKTNVRINNYPFFLSIFLFIMCFGAIYVRHSLFYISLFLMLLSLLKIEQLTFLLSVICLCMYNNITGIIFPIIAISLMFGRPGLIALLGIVAYNYFIKLIPLNNIELVISILLFLPFIYKHYKHKDTTYHNLVENFNEQILKFASFLDNFSRNFTTPSRIQNKISDSFNTIVGSFCERCHKNEECFIKNKNETYTFIKSALIYGNNIHLEKSTTDLKRILKTCDHSNDIINKANFLKNKYNLTESSIKEKALNSQILGISNTIKQYAIDIVSKNEIPLFLFSNLKEKLIKNGFNIIIFNIKKFFVNDFYIELGISYIDEEKINSVVKRIIQAELKTSVSIDINKTINNVIYFNVLPKVNYQLLYGAGSLAKESLNITGDNYLVKDNNNSNFIVALSDGMGSGYKAYEESKLTIDMVDKITDFEINVNTSINMLNTFYSLKDNMDFYATLDLLEINRTTGETILYKMGSSDTILFTNLTLDVINNTNLPFGIDDLISENKLELKENDLVILMTDGIRDNITDSELSDILSLSYIKHPQKITYDILNHIVENKKIEDDMSLITIKIVKNN